VVANMGLESAKRRRKPRADSILNRERLLEAAAEIFAAGGAQASLEAVARRAEVGSAHFTGISRRARRFSKRSTGARSINLAISPTGSPESPILWRLCARGCTPKVRLVAAKKGMIEGLQLAAHASSELKAYSFERLIRALSALLDRGIAARAIRSDVSADDVLRAIVGLIYAQGGGDWQAPALRLVDVFVDGLRARKMSSRDRLHVERPRRRLPQAKDAQPH